MLFRKSRTHFQGTSNRQFQSKHPLQQFESQKVPERKNKRSTNRISQHNLYEVMEKQNKKRKSSELGTQTKDAQSKIKKIYRGRKNLLRIVEKWGFGENGLITAQEFQEKMIKKLGITLNKQQTSQIIRKYGGQNSIGAQGFIKLLHEGTEGIPFDQTIFDHNVQSDQREKMIKNLKNYSHQNFTKEEESQSSYSHLNDYQLNQFVKKINVSLAKMKKGQDYSFPSTSKGLLDLIEEDCSNVRKDREMFMFMKNRIDGYSFLNAVKSNKIVDQYILDPFLRKTQGKKSKGSVKESQSNCQNILPLTTFKCSTFTKSNSTGFIKGMKQYQLDPIMMKDRNQQKTRFGATVFHESQKHNITSKLGDQKAKIDSHLRAERDNAQLRYHNKIEKMRINRYRQKENIDKIQENQERKKRQNFESLKHQKQSYNYINFVKKRWQ